MTDADFELFEQIVRQMEEEKRGLQPAVEVRMVPYGYSKCCEVPFVEDSGFATCPECGLVDELFSFDTPQYYDSVKVRFSSKRAYSRVDTFMAHLDKLTGAYKMKTEEKEAVRGLRNSMKNKAIDYFSIKKELKTLGLQKYYGVIPCVMRELFGIKVLELSNSEINSLTAKFSEFDRKFALQSERKNSVNYYWMTRKFCEELGLDPSKWALCPDLKDAKKKKEMVKIYESIQRLN
jgi:hypothetical protein